MRNKAKFLATLCSFSFILGVQLSEIDRTLKPDILNTEVSGFRNLSRIKEMPSFGFQNLFSDYIFVRFLLYFGDERFKYTGYSESEFFLEAAIHKDPYFMDLYLFLSQSTTIYAGRPHKAVEIMEQGIALLNEHYPDDGYRVWRYKGIDELLFLGDAQAAQNSFSMAATWGSKSSDPYVKEIGRRSAQTAKFLAGNPDSRQAQISAWSSILTTAFDESTRQQAIDRIRALGGDVVFGENGSVSIQYAEAAQPSFETDSDI